MGAFKTTKTLNAPATLIQGIADEITATLSSEGYKVQAATYSGGWYDISVSKTGLFRAIAGLNSALKITLKPVATGIFVEAGVGIFGQQAIPTAISMLLYWPIALTQIWGMVRQAKLDDRVIDIAEKYIAQNAEMTTNSTTIATKFCTVCGKQLAPNATFCSGCGERG